MSYITKEFYPNPMTIDTLHWIPEGEDNMLFARPQTITHPDKVEITGYDIEDRSCKVLGTSQVDPTTDQSQIQRV